jgi:hypothetical protein
LCRLVQQLTNLDVLTALGRHLRGDWGDVDDEDWEVNERALKEGTRLPSLLRSAGGGGVFFDLNHEFSVLPAHPPAASE